MTIEPLRQVHGARPFRPFRLVLADGTHVPVPHPEFLAHAGGGRTVVVFERPEQYRVIDLLLVTCLEIRGEGGRGNGRARRRT
jgi:hypothetical protein